MRGDPEAEAGVLPRIKPFSDFPCNRCGNPCIQVVVCTSLVRER